MAKAVKGVKARAWAMFSRYIRIRDCIETTGFPFTGCCVTCGDKFHISFLDAGHLFAGRSNAKLFQELSVRAQCQICNQRGHGQPEKFRKVMEKRYSVEEVEAWERDGRQMIQNKDMDFDAIAKKYKEKYLALLRKEGFRSYEDKDF